jgi:hypothetical protein
VRLGQLLAAPGVTIINDGTDRLRVSGITAEQIGAAAWRAHLPVYELTPTRASLEEAFMQVTQDSSRIRHSRADGTIQPDGPSTGMAKPYPSPRHATWPARRGLGRVVREDDVLRAGRLPAIVGDRLEGERARQ